MHDYFDRKGGFALEASQHAVRLLYDLADEPTVLGDVSFSDPLLQQKMLALRSEARRLTTGDVKATVIIPTAYVLLRAFGRDFSLRHSQDVTNIHKYPLISSRKRKGNTVYILLTKLQPINDKLTFDFQGEINEHR